MHLRQELEQRGFLYQYTSDALFDLYEKGGQNFYFGCDPTSDSLHLGNFAVFMQAVNYMKKNNHLIMIVGGATGMIGDPGGKDAERTFLSEEQLAHNVEKITQQVQGMLEHLTKLSGENFSFEVINNLDFYRDMNVLDFLRNVGKYITVNVMINKETVKKRVEDPDKSISYTEFSYMLLQAYDYLKLYQEKNVKLQISGSDQRGNITTGVELIRKKLDAEVYGATGPLVLDSSGKKFGKSEGNALFLDPEKTSPYAMYQYFMNTNDEDVDRYLKLFTLLDFPEIQKIIDTHMQDTSKRYGQQQLACYVVTTIFGEDAMKQAEKISGILFGQGSIVQALEQLSSGDQKALLHETGGCTIDSGEHRIVDLCTQSGLTPSNGEAKKMIQSGALYINDTKLEDIAYVIQDNDWINGVILLRKGKKTFKTVIKS